MKKYKSLIVLIVLFFTFISINTVFGYGFGVKKNKEHKQPDVGIYKGIIESNNGMYVGDKNKKEIYLTFDCGYENGYTMKILDTLKEKNVNATFFITGHYVNSAQNEILRMVKDNHVVANHSNKHKDITKITAEEIKKEILDLEVMYKNLTNQELTKFFRPPAGNFDQKSLSVVSSLGYTSLFWSLSYKDWDHKNSVNYTVKEVVDNIHNGAIILMHAVSEANELALPLIIDELRNLGYEFASTKKLLIN